MNQNLRLFIALELPRTFLESLGQDLAELRAGHPEFRWTPEENMHITVAFLGEVDLPGVAVDIAASAAAAAAASGRPIPVRAGCLRTLPAGRPASVLAVTVGAGAEEIAALEASLRQALEAAFQSAAPGAAAAGVTPRRPFLPHITVARGGRSALRLDRKERSVPVSAAGVLTTLTVFSSELRSGGAVYQGLYRYTLGRQGGRVV